MNIFKVFQGKLLHIQKEDINTGSKNFFKLKFDFDESWSEFINFRFVEFYQNVECPHFKVTIEESGIANIPIEVLYSTLPIYIGVCAENIDGTIIANTNFVKINSFYGANTEKNNVVFPETQNNFYALYSPNDNLRYLKVNNGTLEFSKDNKTWVAISGGFDKETLDNAIEEKTKDLTSVTVGGEVQKTFNADTKADKSLVNNLKAQVDINTQIIAQSGLGYKADTVDTYTERVTAEGLNILDGQKSLLKKVEGNTVACQNLFKFDELVGENGGSVSEQINFENETITLSSNANLYIIGISFEDGAFETFNKVLNITEAGVYCLRVKITDLNGNPLQNAEMRSGWILFANMTNGSVSSSYSTNINGFHYFAKFNITQEKLDLIKSSENNSFRLYMYGSLDKTTRVNIDSIVSEFTFCKGDYTLETMPKYQPYFIGLKSSTFGGIESTSEDGTKSETFTFPKTETPYGTTIDFEKQVIENYGVEVVLTGNETVGYYPYQNKRNCVTFNIKNYQITNGIYSDGYVSTDSVYKGNLSNNSFLFFSLYICWLDILDTLGFTTNGTLLTSAEEQAEAVSKFKAWITERYASGNPVILRYVSSELQSSRPFTETEKARGNEIVAYLKGTEKVLENDGAEFVADNTLTQNYLFVTGVKQ